MYAYLSRTKDTDVADYSTNFHVLIPNNMFGNIPCVVVAGSGYMIVLFANANSSIWTILKLLSVPKGSLSIWKNIQSVIKFGYLKSMHCELVILGCYNQYLPCYILFGNYLTLSRLYVMLQGIAYIIGARIKNRRPSRPLLYTRANIFSGRRNSQ